MAWWRCRAVCLVVVAVLSPCAWARDFTFTFRIDPGRSECFYDYIHEGAFLEIEYQVIDGGNLDINFVVSDPDKHPVVMEPRSMDGLHGLDVKKTGEYEICLDNSFSSLSDKLLFLDIIIEDDSGEDEEEEEVVPYQLTKGAIALDVKVQDMKKRLNTIGDKLNKVTTHQHFFKARESRHRHTVESSHTRVFWWSFLEISIILTVGIVQVFVIRSLFKTTRKDRIRT